ncbi:MAG: HK97 family phage prohead protease [Actinobacteria bacterium]|nr:HK97 family phage prohead protease [Actinomycetota bacterium]
MEALQFKSFDIIDHKADNAGNLIINGYGAVFGNIDSDNEIYAKGAFTRTLKTRAGRIAFCYQHDIWNPIGKILNISEDSKGLPIKVMVSAADEDIQTKVKEGILKELSVGYRVTADHKETRAGKEVRVLDEVELYEVSIVTIAANPLTVIQSMKSEEKADYLSKEFDRIISIVRNENINFELRKLKSLVFAGKKAETPPENPDTTQMTVEEILRLLTSKN